jgi:hypothetical protein
VAAVNIDRNAGRSGHKRLACPRQKQSLLIGSPIKNMKNHLTNPYFRLNSHI